MNHNSAKDVLNKISPTACMAKWYRTNLRLDTGVSYSCHHCTPQQIDVEAIKINPNSLTNTQQVLQDRQEMLSGTKPKECNYCWTAEGNDDVSDRLIKSSDFMRLLDIKDVDNITMQNMKDTSSLPLAIDVSFDRTCNLKCAYCGPKFSSTWEQEMKQFGSYPTSTKRQDLDFNTILNREHNPYVEAFWKWWPDLKDHLRRVRVTGGEPLLSKNTYKFLDMCAEENNPNLEISINSNFSVDINPLLDKLKNNTFKNFRLYVSLESNKLKSEYNRFGLDYDLFTSNVGKYLKETNHRLHFMLTNNLLSITGYSEFLEYYISLKKKYGRRLMLMSTQLRYPQYLDIRLLDKKNKTQVQNKIAKVITSPFLSKYEKEIIQRTSNYMDIDIDNKELLRNDFISFVKEADKRRETNFLETYPEYTEIFNNWYSIA